MFASKANKKSVYGSLQNLNPPTKVLTIDFKDREKLFSILDWEFQYDENDLEIGSSHDNLSEIKAFNTASKSNASTVTFNSSSNVVDSKYQIHIDESWVQSSYEFEKDLTGNNHPSSLTDDNTQKKISIHDESEKFLTTQPVTNVRFFFNIRPPDILDNIPDEVDDSDHSDEDDDYITHVPGKIFLWS